MKIDFSEVYADREKQGDSFMIIKFPEYTGKPPFIVEMTDEEFPIFARLMAPVCLAMKELEDK